jgi:hypothetical protein
MVPFRQAHRFGEPQPQRPARRELLGEAVGAHESVAVERLAVTKSDQVHHPVAVEGVIRLERTGPWRPQTTEWDADDLDVLGGQVREVDTLAGGLRAKSLW